MLHGDFASSGRAEKLLSSCNPCGEQFLHFSNSCNLGSIDLSKFYLQAGDGTDPDSCVDWDRLRRVTHLSTQFLDNVIDTCQWPLTEVEDVVKRTRPVGLGIMGFADLCLKLKVTYGEGESIKLMDKVMGFVRKEAWVASMELGAEKGVFPELEANKDAYAEFSDAGYWKSSQRGRPCKPCSRLSRLLYSQRLACACQKHCSRWSKHRPRGRYVCLAWGRGFVDRADTVRI